MRKTAILSLLTLALLSSCGKPGPSPYDEIEPGSFIEIENNDSFSKANVVYAADGTKDVELHRSITVRGTIDRHEEPRKDPDYDFFSYDKMTYGTLQITLTDIPERCDYDFFVFRLDNDVAGDPLRMEQNPANHRAFCRAKSGGIGGDEKAKIRNLAPGTYYILVSSYINRYSDPNSPYTLRIEETADDKRENRIYSLEEGKARGERFALWESDYAPAGVRAISASPINARRSLPFYDRHPMLRHLGRNLEPREKYVYAVLYVWDKECIELIHRFYETMYEEAIKFRDGDDEYSFLWWAEKAWISRLGTIAATKSDFELMEALWSHALSLTRYISGRGPEAQRRFQGDIIPFARTMRDLSEYAPGKALRIPFGYDFTVEKGRHFLNFAPAYIIGETYRVFDPCITPYVQPGAVSTGTVKGFSSIEDLVSLLTFF